MNIGAECSRKANASPYRRLARRWDGLRVHEIDGEALVYDQHSADTHHLNETAYFVWNHCDGERTLNEIARFVTKVYDVEIQEALIHVEQVVVELQRRGLLTNAPFDVTDNPTSLLGAANHAD